MVEGLARLVGAIDRHIQKCVFKPAKIELLCHAGAATNRNLRAGLEYILQVGCLIML